MRAKAKRKPTQRRKATYPPKWRVLSGGTEINKEPTALPLSVAETLTTRQSTHGDFSENARVMQGIKQILRSGGNWYGDLSGARQFGMKPANLSDAQAEAIENIVVKLGRIVTGDPNNPDHYLDIEGYARLARERLTS